MCMTILVFSLLIAIVLRLLLLQFRKQPDVTERLLKTAIANCRDETVKRWLRENSPGFFQSGNFGKLVDMFNFWKKHIDEEEKKNHSDNVHITFVAHGAIRDFMIPAICLRPLPTITDVVLYVPWNSLSAGGSALDYAIATGKIKPQHSVFYSEDKACTIPDDIPDHFNSMKDAGGREVPNISVSPLRPNDGVLEGYKSYTDKYGPLERNRIFIPFILPGKESESVQFSVVMLALSLVLHSSRFKATVHVNTCLRDKSTGQKFHKEQLKEQYAYAMDGIKMKVSPDVFKQTWKEWFQSWFWSRKC